MPACKLFFCHSADVHSHNSECLAVILNWMQRYEHLFLMPHSSMSHSFCCWCMFVCLCAVVSLVLVIPVACLLQYTKIVNAGMGMIGQECLHEQVGLVG